MRRLADTLRRVPLAGKIYVIVGLFVAAQIGVLVAVNTRFQINSAVRAYVAGESLWSKGQKDAVYHLVRYAHSGDARDYERYRAAIDVTLGDKQARLELLKPHPDFDRAREGFARGGNHPDDIPALIMLFRTFGQVSYMKRAITIWTEGDSHIARLMKVAEELHQHLSSGRLAEKRKEALLADIHALNDALTPLEKEFSSVLGEAARSVRRTLIAASAALTALLLAGVLLLSWGILRLIKKTEAERDRLYTLSPDMFCVVDFDGDRLRNVNPAWTRILGHREEELHDRPALEFIHPDDHEMTRAEFRRIKAGATSLDFENRYRRKDGNYRVIRWNSTPLAAQGKFYCVGRDVTDEKAAAAALHFRDQALQAVSVGMLIMDATRPGCPITYANAAMTRLTGYKPDELLGRRFDFFHGPDTDAARITELECAIAAQRDGLFELLCYRKDHTCFWNAVAISPIHRQDGRLTHFVSIHTDLTPVRRLEERLTHAQKMEAMGRLAGGVAHDFNNILTAILGYCEELLARPATDDFAVVQAGQIKKSAERAAALTRRLLAFSRAQPLRPRPINLSTIVLDLEKMLRRLIRENIVLALQVDSKPVTIHADPGQIEQVILNLVVNARDAMPRGGHLSIRASTIHVTDPPPTGLRRLQPGPYATLTITDTGVGMNDEVRAHLFEPFFTTKDKGNGTGLGLASVYGIVKQSGGDILVESNLNVGTTFQLIFPASAVDSREPFAPPPEKPALGRGAGEIILIAEDESDLCYLMRGMLDRLGYTVLVGEDGIAVQQLLARDPLMKVDLLITDVVMPRLGGRELADWVLAHRPSTKVLFISGFIDDPTTRQIVARADTHFLEKPFTLATLAAKVRHILDLPTAVAGTADRNRGSRAVPPAHDQPERL